MRRPPVAARPTPAPEPAPLPPPPPEPAGPAGSAADLHRGMSAQEVHEIMGKPTRRKPGVQGDLKTLSEWYEEGDRVTEVVYVGGVVVRFSTSSR